MAYDFIDSVGNDVDVVSDSEVSVFTVTLGICSAAGEGRRMLKRVMLYSLAISNGIRQSYVIIQYLCLL